MSHYKALNKELVEQMQNMKIQLNAYCNEIVHLKRGMMENHESKVILKKQCFNWAVKSFKNLIETIEPECSLIEKIQEYEPQIEILPPMRNFNETNNRSVNSLRYSTDRRRSSELREELQRSNSIIHSRNSMSSTSPVRLSSGEKNPEEAEETNETTKEQGQNFEETILEESEDEIEELESEMELTQCVQKTDETVSQTLQVNIENTNEKLDEVTTNNEENSLNESVEEISLDISNESSMQEIPLEISSPVRVLRNVTNKNNPQKQMKQKQKRRVENLKQNLKSHDESLESTDSSPAITRDRHKKSANATQKIDKKLRKTDTIPVSMDVEESIQENRASPKEYNGRHSKSMHVPHVLRPDGPTTSFTVNDVTLENFNAAVASSTPNSRHNSIQNVKANNTNTLETDSSPTLLPTNSRPTRKCKPKLLEEPKIGKKLRNEGSVIFKTKKRRK